MSKRSIAYIKPEEPNFLKRLKQQIGYKEGPTVDTKRADLGPVRDENCVDTDEEQPTIVVLDAGDLTAAEVSQEKARLEKQAAETPADLNSRIVFKTPNKVKNPENKVNQTTKSKEELSSSAATATAKKTSKKGKNTALLSFDEDENDD